MLFSSIPFLFYFLPAVLLLYFLVPKRGKNAVLLAASLLFYAWGEPKYVLLMAASILFSYGMALLLARNRKKILFFLSIAAMLLLLGYFKYVDFFIESFNAVTGLSVPLLRVALPIGISFYTFQILSYLSDVYRGAVPPQKNLIDYATFVALFPQLIAGPIVRYADIAEELSHRTHGFEGLRLGLRRFLIGLAKKVLLANALGEFCEIFRASGQPSVAFFWLYAIAFAMHIYFDFSGYSDMAIGLGRVFGFRFPENFDYPYLSRSATEFWRRWHKTLGGWFRDYVYIPLGGNRVPKYKWVRNVLVVWLLTGAWHGAAWNFILWGLLFGVLLLLEKLVYGKFLARSRVLSHAYLLLVVLLSFVLFNAESLAQAGGDFAAMFGFAHLPFVSSETAYYFGSYAVLFVCGAIGCTPLLKRCAEKIAATKAGSRVFVVLEPVFLIALLLCVTAYLVDGSFNPFLYFRF